MIEIIQDIYKFVFGLCIGSFLNVVIYRIPEGISLISPRSFCPNCKKKILFRENLPIISWIFQKGKCSKCKININIRYPVIEILTAVLFVVLSKSSPQLYSFNQGLFIEEIFSWLFLSLLLVISFIDIEHYWIPQELINFGFLSGLINMTLIGIINNKTLVNFLLKGLIASLVSFILLEILRLSAKKIYKRDAIGQGDSKLISMMTLWLGPLGISLGIGLSYVIAAFFILILFLVKGVKKGQIIPFAPFLSIGGLIVWYFGNETLLRIIYNI